MIVLKRFPLIAALTLLISLTASALPPPVLPLSAEAREDRLILVHADVLESVTDAEGRAVQFLKGRVEFRKGDVHLTSATVTYREREGIATFGPGATLTQEGKVLKAGTLVFQSMADLVTARGSVRYSDSTATLSADTLTYSTEVDTGIARGHASLTQRGQTMTADEIRYRHDAASGAFSYAARGAVVVREGGREARCGRGEYDAASGTTRLTEDPVLRDGERTVMGAEITLHDLDGKIGRVVIPAEARVLYPSPGATAREGTPPLDDLRSQSLEGYLSNGDLDSLRLTGMASVLYHLYEDTVYRGENLASGDTILLRFAADNLGRRSLGVIEIVGGGRGLYTPEPHSERVHGPIAYRADEIHYDLPRETTVLSGSAEVTYGSSLLSAGSISVAWQENLLSATPRLSSTGAVAATRPTFRDSGEKPIVGDSITFDLSTEHGRVVAGKTQLEDGYYHGEEIRNRPGDVFYVTGGAYTTCTLDPNPHFHFESRQMKIITSDIVVARPIVLYLAGVPVFALPFGVFPDQAGERHSGWIMPSYGQNLQHGRFIKGLGYFFAVNDHWNTLSTLDFSDRSGIVLRNKNRYVFRYHASGDLDLAYYRTVRDQDIANLWEAPEEIQWSAAWRHHHKMRHRQTLNANGRYFSDSRFNRRVGIDLATRLDQNALSSATYSKSWPEQNVSLSLTASHNVNLMANERVNPSSLYYQSPSRPGGRVTSASSSLPTLSLRKGQTPLLSKGPGSRGLNLYWSYQGTMKNQGSRFFEVGADTLWGALESDYQQSWVHSASLSGSGKLFRYFTVNPSVSTKEEWVSRAFSADSVSETGAVARHEQRGLHARHTASLSVGASTNLYGLLPIRLGNLLALRHTITPSVSIGYEPDYSRPLFGLDFGYFEEVRDFTGAVHLSDRFEGTPIGPTPRRDRRTLSFSLRNLLQAKVRDGDRERKLDNLVIWNFSSGYDFAADSLGLSPIRSSIRTRMPNRLSLDFTLTHDPYAVRISGSKARRVDAWADSRWGVPIPRLVDASAATGFRLSGEAEAPSEVAEADTADAEDLSAASVRERQARRGGRGLWDATVALRYSVNRANPENPRETFWSNLDLALHPTTAWGLRYSARFDLINRKLVNHELHVTRDLHCWELDFTWVPSGFLTGYFLRLSVKSPTLRDLKIESRGGRWRLPWS